MKNSVKHFIPHPLLFQYVEEYTLRKIRLGKGETIEKLMPHRTLTSLEFFLADPHKKFDLQTGKEENTLTNTIRGLRTFSKYKIQIGGQFLSLTVKFRPSGMYGLLGVPMKYLTNEDIELSEMDILPVNEIESRLREVENENDYRLILDEYLLKLYKNRTFEMRLLPFLFSEKKPLNITVLADELNISVRQVERIFLNEVGLSFTKWQQLQKFDATIKRKIQEPQTSWTHLAHQFDFYDQPDFTKTFKNYLSTIPSRFNPADWAF